MSPNPVNLLGLGPWMSPNPMNLYGLGPRGTGFYFKCGSILWSLPRAREKRRGFDLKCESCGRGPDPRRWASVLNVCLVVEARTPGVGFSIKCASCCRGPVPWEWVSILNMHLVDVARGPRRGLRSTNVVFCVMCVSLLMCFGCNTNSR